MGFCSRFRKSFKKELRHLTRRNKALKKRIEKAVLKLEESPYDQSQSYGDEYKGKRKHRLGDYRLVFAICEECRKNERQKSNGCNDCNQYEDNTLMFFTVFHRGKDYS